MRSHGCLDELRVHGEAGLLRDSLEHPVGLSIYLPLTTLTIIFAGSYCNALHRNSREPTKEMVLVVEGITGLITQHAVGVTENRPFRETISRLISAVLSTHYVS